MCGKMCGLNGRSVQELVRELNRELLEAVEKNECAKVRQLIERGAQVDARWDDDEAFKRSHTPLIRAAELGYEEMAKMLLELGADKDAVSHFGNSALMIALTHGHWDIIRLLLESGADPNKKNFYGESMLSYIQTGIDYLKRFGAKE